MDDTLHFTFELNDAEDLFVAPDYDPFDENSYERPVLEIIGGYLEAHSLKTPARATIHLPPGQITPDLPERFRRALSRFVDRRTQENLIAMRSNHNVGWRLALYAVVIIVIMVFLLGAISWLADQGFWWYLAAGVCLTVFYVVTWRPVETLIFDNLAPRRMNGIWQKIATMPIEFKPAPAPAGSVGVKGAAL